MDWNERLSQLAEEKSFSKVPKIPNDVAFVIDGQRVEAHKFVISMRSNVFRKHFCVSQESQEEEEEVAAFTSSQLAREDLINNPVVIFDVSHRIFQLMINFIYKTQLDENLDRETLLSLAQAAVRYEVEDLEDVCKSEVNRLEAETTSALNRTPEGEESQMASRNTGREVPQGPGEKQPTFQPSSPEMFDKGYSSSVVSSVSIGSSSPPPKVSSNPSDEERQEKVDAKPNTVVQKKDEIDKKKEENKKEVKPTTKDSKVNKLPLEQRPAPAAVKRKRLLETMALASPKKTITANANGPAPASVKKQRLPKPPLNVVRKLSWGVEETIETIGDTNNIKMTVKGDVNSKERVSYAQLISDLTRHTSDGKWLCKIDWINLDIHEAYGKSRQKFEKFIVLLQEFHLSLFLKSLNSDQLKEFMKKINLEEYLFFILATDIDSQFVRYLLQYASINVVVNGRTIVKAESDEESLTVGFAARSKDIVENLSRTIIVRKLSVGHCDFPQTLDNLFESALRELVVSNCTVEFKSTLLNLLKRADKLTKLVVSNCRLPRKTSLKLNLNEEIFASRDHLKHLVINDAIVVVGTKKNVIFPVLEKLVIGDVIVDLETFQTKLPSMFPRLKEVVIFGSSCMKVKHELVVSFKHLKFIESIEVWNLDMEALGECRIKRGGSESTVKSLKLDLMQNFKVVKGDDGKWMTERLAVIEKRNRQFVELHENKFFSGVEFYADHMDPTVVICE